MLEKIKERVKAWKRLYVQDCQKCDENSSWYDILMELEYYRFSNYYPSGRNKLQEAIKVIGTFSSEEKKYLDKLPAYTTVRLYLTFDDYRDDFYDTINGMKVFSSCLPKNGDIPIRKYTIVTDREDLWDLEIYIFKSAPHFRRERHGIIRFAKEAPADYVEPKYSDDD